MKKIIYTAIIAFASSAVLMSQAASTYKAGEKVNYTIHYGVISAGTGSLELTSETLDGKVVLHSKLVGRTTGMAETFFKLLDIYESYFDPVRVRQFHIRSEKKLTILFIMVLSQRESDHLN